MNQRYKAIITKRDLYIEINLDPTKKVVQFGTNKNSDIRIRRKQFFEDFVIEFHLLNNTWYAECDENIYFYIGDIRKLKNIELKASEEINVYSDRTNEEMFKIEFLKDFDRGTIQYNQAIDISCKPIFYIGAQQGSEIALSSDYANQEKVKVTVKNQDLEIVPIKTVQGIFVNGIKIAKEAILSDTDFLSIADYTFYFKDKKLWTEKRDDLRLNGFSFFERPDLRNYPHFFRNTREKIVINKEKIEILDPPTKPVKPKNNLVMSLLPAVGMLITSGLMAFMGQTMIIFSLITGGMAIVLAVATLIDGNITYKKEIKERNQAYTEYIEKKKREINEFREDEKNKLNFLFPDVPEKKKNLERFSSDLFDRVPSDKDFLNVRLGTGAVSASRIIDYKVQERMEEDELQSIPQKIAEEFKMISGAPIICDLKKASVIGIIGKEKNRYAMFKNIVFDLLIRQYPTDFSTIFIAEPKHKHKIDFLRFLPQVNNEEIGFRTIAYSEESKNRIFDLLYKTLSERSEKKEKDPEHVLVFFYDEYGFMTHPLSRFLESAKDYNFTFVFMGENKSEIPLGCNYHIYVDEDNKGKILDTNDKTKIEEFQFQIIPDQYFKETAHFLTPIQSKEISLESELVQSITLFDLMKITNVDELNLQERWANTKVYDSMAVPIGVTKSDQIYLDLHDKADGPHGLVAGTTGSGKSEILLTYILSMSTWFHPYEIGFVIIDFKGGGMVNQLEELPHLLGSITNIDGKEIDRSLRFIRAELQKRQRLFMEANVNHIDKYIKKFKSGEVKTPLPHLILIVDEFAELKAEQPDFMQELISTARIGRSLGVHLILATQKPAGQVDDQIWSNSRFKLCLKVQTKEDSNEVIKSPLAAEIKEPGRAYLQVGNNEIFELFQSAYSGATVTFADNTKEFKIFEILENGRKKEIYSRKRRKEESNETQLDALVKYVDTYFTQVGEKRLQGICLPPLEKEIPFEEKIKNGKVSIGIYDDPDNQAQEPNYIDLENKNTFILGSSQFGKTNLLMSIIRSIAQHGSARENIFYILDFGSMILKNFEDLNHVGGVVISSEDEKLKNLLKLLFEEITIRKEKILDAGVGSFQSYIEAGYTDLPRIYLIIDNFIAALELFFEDDESILMILREGLSVGITTIITSAQTARIGYRYLSNFANRISFYCNDASEYMSVFEQDSVRPEEIPGRCIYSMDKRILECQTYLAFSGEKELDRINNVRNFVKDINQKYSGVYAKKIPSIPKKLTLEYLKEQYAVESNHYLIPLGLSYETVSPVFIDFSKGGVLAVCTEEAEQKKYLIDYFIKSLNWDKEKSPIEAIVLDSPTRELSFIQKYDIVQEYSIDSEKIRFVLANWKEVLQNRFEDLMVGTLDLNNSKLLLLIINNKDIAKVIDSDFDLSDQLNEIITRYQNLNIRILLTDYPNTTTSYDAPSLYQKIREERNVIYYGNLDSFKPFDVPYEALKINKKRIEENDAYYIENEEYTRLKLISE